MVEPTEIESAKRVNLIQVAQRSVKLTRHSSRLMGLCAFHWEKTPSMCVSPERYHCFGCGADGDVIEWVREINGLTFEAAIHHLNGDSRNSASNRKIERRESQAPSVPASQCDRSETARAIWKRRRPTASQLINYLRSRAHTGLIPATVGYLPADGGYDHAMIAAFGLAYRSLRLDQP